jgi:hypothetical protein
MTKTKNKSLNQAIMGLAIVLSMSIVVWSLYTFVTSKYPGANDFYQRWIGAKVFWLEGRDPYGADVARETEIFLYGRPYNPDPALNEFPGDFLYPFNTVILLAPIAGVSYAVASAIWFAFLALLIVICFVMLVDLFKWRVSPLMLVLGIIWAVTFYPALRGIFMGQIGTFVACLHLMILWALAKRHDIFAGILIALSTIKPQLGIFLIPFVILWALRYQRWRFLVNAAVSTVIFVGASLLLMPSWPAKWLEQAGRYTGYTNIGSPVWIITHDYLPFLGRPVELAVSAGLVLLMLWAWYEVLWLRKSEWFNWTVALTLTITQLVWVRTGTPHYVVFFYVIVFYLRNLSRRAGNMAVIGIMVVSSVALWWLFLATVFNRIESEIMYLPLPILSLLILLITRRQWRSTVGISQPNAVASRETIGV